MRLDIFKQKIIGIIDHFALAESKTKKTFNKPSDPNPEFETWISIFKGLAVSAPVETMKDSPSSVSSTVLIFFVGRNIYDYSIYHRIKPNQRNHIEKFDWCLGMKPKNIIYTY